MDEHRLVLVLGLKTDFTQRERSLQGKGTRRKAQKPKAKKQNPKYKAQGARNKVQGARNKKRA
jgi:hypothetical protein